MQLHPLTLPTCARRCAMARACAALVCMLVFGAPLQAQTIDLAKQSVTQLPQGATSMTVAIHGVTLGMPWGEARNVLDRGNVPYIFTKGTSPVVYVPPTNSTYYYVLNPSSYDVIEMGVIGTADLPIDNQFLFDAQRWKLTTARTQFFGHEGEFIVNEEGEAYNFPYHGFVLKYILPSSFRFVMVQPTNKPLTSYGQKPRPEGAAPAQAPAFTPPPPPPPPPPQPDLSLDRWISAFQKAREQFEARAYAAALTGFRTIAEQAPDPLLRIRSVYWMGESHYGLKQYRNAKVMFERVLRETDIAALREPALKMLAYCKQKLR